MNNIIRTRYCDECKKDIPVEELEDGTVIIHCPKCVGECMLCDCHLVKECFPGAARVTIQHPDSGKESAL
ncbi:MAG: hypothetical protein ACE5IW_02370 [bacterium]